MTTILPLYCFAANIAGDLAEVDNLLESGVGPHDYQFSPRDLRKLSSADLLIANGLGLESWMEKILANSTENSSRIFLEASSGLDDELIHGTTALHLTGESAGHTHEHDSESPNPHFWLNPQLAAHAVTNILVAFQKADPTNAPAYATNAERYIESLKSLDKELLRRAEALQNGAFITFHDAFPYFTQHYNLKLVGVVEEIPDVTPSQKYLKSLQEVIRANEVEVIFTEPQFSSKLVEQLAQHLKISIDELDPMESGELSKTAYEDGMRRNMATLEKHLKNGNN